MRENWSDLIAAVAFLDQVDPKKIALSSNLQEAVTSLYQSLKTENESEAVMKCIDLIESWNA